MTQNDCLKKLKSEKDHMNYLPVIVPQFEVGCRHDFDLNKFTSVINVSPTNLWIQSKSFLKGIQNVPQASWQYQLEIRHSDEIETSINDILSVFYEYKDIIRPFIEKNHLEMTAYLRVYVTIGLDGYPLYPLMEITHPTLNHLNDLGVGFQIDIFSIDKIESIENLERTGFTERNDIKTWIFKKNNNE